jgi:hypothetical protein
VQLGFCGQPNLTVARIPFQRNVEQYVAESYDTIALFLCVHLVIRFRALCHDKVIGQVSSASQFFRFRLTYTLQINYD